MWVFSLMFISLLGPLEVFASYEFKASVNGKSFCIIFFIKLVTLLPHPELFLEVILDFHIKQFIYLIVTFLKPSCLFNRE